MTCPTCPVPAGSTCVAITRNHPRYCELADPSHPDFIPKIRDDVLADSTGQSRAGNAAPPASSSVAMEPEEIASRASAESCRNLDGCHCNGSARCLLRRPTDGSPWPILEWSDCLACVRAGEHSPRG